MTQFVSKRYKLSKHGGTFLITLALSFGAQAMEQQGQQAAQQCTKEKGVEVIRTHVDEVPVVSHQDLKAGKKVQVHETQTTVTYTTEVRNYEEEDYESDEEHTIISGTPTVTTTYIKKAQMPKQECKQEICNQQAPMQQQQQECESSSSSSEEGACNNQQQAQQGLCNTNAQQAQCEAIPEQCIKGKTFEFTFMQSPYLAMDRLKLLQKRAQLPRGKNSNGKNIRVASDFKFVGYDFGKRISHNKHRAVNWNGSQFNNFAFDHIEGRSVNAHNANWSNFYVHGKIMDWEFNGATLCNGWFNADIRSLVFKNATLTNVTFMGSTLGDTGWKLGRDTTFKNAKLTNVSFEGADLDDVTFEGAQFFYNANKCGNTNACQAIFTNTRVNFQKNWVGVKFVDENQKVYEITQARAQKLDNKFQTWTGPKTITQQQMFQTMDQM